MTPRNQSAGFPELLTQMRITNRLLAAQLKDRMKQNDLIILLSTTDASDQEIADAVNTTAATVRVALHRQKKKMSKQAQ